ncbi:MAG: hypothetical protein GWP61_03075 [Chloroflexi bacterium]|jgi:hypothetical protein|nr:hypothetical protein [Chloroflexota bacterium]
MNELQLIPSTVVASWMQDLLRRLGSRRHARAPQVVVPPPAARQRVIYGHRLQLVAVYS